MIDATLDNFLLLSKNPHGNLRLLYLNHVDPADAHTQNVDSYPPQTKIRYKYII